MRESPSGPQLDILLIEDHEPDAFLTRQLLEGAAHPSQVHVVNGGRAALQFLRREGAHEDAPVADLILLDLELPDLHGREVLRQIRALDGVPAPVIIVSGAREGRVGEYLHGGAVDYVMKGDARPLREAVDSTAAAWLRLQKLSPMQRRVLRGIADGRTTQELAQALDISVKTVETHRAEVTKRLGIRSVPGLVRFAMQVGLVEVRPTAAQSGR